MKGIKREDIVALVKGSTIVDIDSPHEGILWIELADGRVMVLSSGTDELKQGVIMFPSKQSMLAKFEAFKKQIDTMQALKDAVEAVIDKHMKAHPEMKVELVGPIPVAGGQIAEQEKTPEEVVDEVMARLRRGRSSEIN